MTSFAEIWKYAPLRFRSVDSGDEKSSAISTYSPGNIILTCTYKHTYDYVHAVQVYMHTVHTVNTVHTYIHKYLHT